MKYLIWDFDGTLGYRDPSWTGVLLQIAQDEAPEMGVTAEQIRAFNQTGYPWHTPDQPHPHLSDPDDWWRSLEPIIARVFAGVGFEGKRARMLARRVRAAYVAPGGWHLYPDTVPALQQLQAAGWTHIVLSNHVPELRSIIEELRLEPYLARVFNSAVTGFEKPHPEAFRLVLENLVGAEAIWMIGDSLAADVRGAEAAGIPAILVRKPQAGARFFCEGLAQVIEVLGKES